VTRWRSEQTGGGVNIEALDEELAERFNGYRTYLQTQPLAAHTGRTYAGRVGGYLAWLAECDPVLRRQHGDPFTTGHARDYTIRDYRTHLITERQAKPASVNPRPRRARPPLPLGRARSGPGSPRGPATSRPTGTDRG
jgi:hypothetical protein